MVERAAEDYAKMFQSVNPDREVSVQKIPNLHESIHYSQI